MKSHKERKSIKSKQVPSFSAGVRPVCPLSYRRFRTAPNNTGIVRFFRFPGTKGTQKGKFNLHMEKMEISYIESKKHFSVPRVPFFRFSGIRQEYNNVTTLHTYRCV